MGEAALAVSPPFLWFTDLIIDAGKKSASRGGHHGDRPRVTDPGFFVGHDPHPLWQQLRREDPVHWTEGLVRPFWSVTRYEDIVAVFSEPNLFTSTRGLVVPSSLEMEQLTPESMGAGQMMLMTDPPLHTAMRRAFNRLFPPRLVGRYESPGEALVGEILAGVLADGECDFVVDVAARLPMAFICEIMGIRAKTGPICSSGATCQWVRKIPSTRLSQGPRWKLSRKALKESAGT
jgi:cytochrome P450